MESDLHTRPSVEAVSQLLLQLGVHEAVPDLGGTMSLNLHLQDLGLVLRVHPRFVTAERLTALRTLRSSLADLGLVVGAPRPVLGQDFLDVGGRLVEAETFVAAEEPAATWESYVWMFGAMGLLHRAIGAPASEVPPPVVATYATPDEIRSGIAATAAAVREDDEAAGMAASVRAMVDDLARQWVPVEELPHQLIHGDIRLGNVCTTTDGQDAYFDFGFAAWRPRIHELAYSLFWMILKPDDSGRGEDFGWPRVRELVDAYSEGSGTRLDPLELRALGPCLASVPMYLASIASQTRDPVARIKEERTPLDIARWVLDHPADVVAAIAH